MLDLKPREMNEVRAQENKGDAEEERWVRGGAVILHGEAVVSMIVHLCLLERESLVLELIQEFFR